MAAMQTEEKTFSKIEMLLRKAESTEYPEEAETYMAAAEKLMLKHGIDRARLDSKSSKKDEIVIEKIPFPGMWQTAWTDGFSMVVTTLGLRALQSKRGGMTILWIVGHKRDVDDAVSLVNSLRIQSEVALMVWWKKYLPENKFLTSHERHVEKRSFMEAFGVGAALRIRDERQEAAKAAGPGTDVVLRDRSAEIDLFVDISLGVKPAAARRAQVGYSGHVAGREAGKEATRRKQVGE